MTRDFAYGKIEYNVYDPDPDEDDDPEDDEIPDPLVDLPDEIGWPQLSNGEWSSV